MAELFRGPLGAHFRDGGTLFRVFAPRATKVEVVIEGAHRPLQTNGTGCFAGFIDGALAGMRYRYALDGDLVTDPYARFLPDGVHGEAEIVASAYAWTANCRPVDFARAQSIYELHVGTFTPEGTFAAAMERLEYLRDLGVTTIELMPVAAYAGQRGWGYDGVAMYAPHAPYGRPEDLKLLIDRAHSLGLSMVLDVVLNHFGPDGNYLGKFADTYFNDERQTLWGPAPSCDQPHMRRLLLDLVSIWLEQYRFDGLRLDATHAIVDPSRPHLLTEAAAMAQRMSPRRVLIAEDERNEPGMFTEHRLDAVWADDFHHLVHVLTTGEKHGYYQKYSGAVSDLARCIQGGWLEGQPFSLARKGRERLIACLQNHDQVGNRANGERLSHLISSDTYLGASLLLLLLPYTPLVFMGQEWAASSPFLYFTDHHGELGKAVTEGRKREFDLETLPDPQARETFERSRLDWNERHNQKHMRVYELYRRALLLRRQDPLMSRPADIAVNADAVGDVLCVKMRGRGASRLLVWNTGKRAVSLKTLNITSPLVISSVDLVDDKIPPQACAYFGKA